MTATATLEGEQLVSTPSTGTIFLARRDELRLVKRPGRPIRGESGQQVDVTPSEVVAFRSGRFFCPSEGTVVLEDGREVDAKDVHDWLLRHKRLNDPEEGFWAVIETAPPVSQEEASRIVNAATGWEIETLEAIIAQEREGWGRAEVIDVAQTAIDRIRAKEAELQAKVEAENAGKAKAK